MMKNLCFFTLILMFSASLMAQNSPKKVAVWETKCDDNSITSFQSTMVRGAMEAAVANAQGYTGYDRAAFDAIVKEQNFQRSGAVSDSEIKRMGMMAGVQYIIVPEATADGNDFYIIVKMLDVETGEFGAAYEALCSSSATDIKKTCSQLGARLFQSSGTPVYPVKDKQTENNQTNTANTKISAGPAALSFNVNGVSFDMIKVEAGSFTMGCTSEQSDCSNNETPSHQVTLTKDYYIGKYEVTQELYEAVMSTNPSKRKEAECPVEEVDWNDAQRFCSELSRMTGRKFRLPTEAEWEFAARGGNKSTNAMYSGSSSVANVVWYDENSGRKTHPVGQLKPNELGIYDMSGNVWEWCSDCYGSYSKTSQTDPIGAKSGSNRVLRGGSWDDRAVCCRVSYRGRISPDSSEGNRGFRVVMEP